MILDPLYKVFWRKIVKGSDEKRMVKQTLPEGIVAINDIPYVDDGKQEHLLDIYYPENAEGKLPVVIDFHGGGFMYAYKELNKNYCYHIAKRGFAVINVSYSIAPENRYPTFVVDAMKALKWIGEHIGDYEFLDKDKVFVTGDSAGGMLAANAVLIATSDELQKVYGVDPIDLDIKAIGITSGMLYYNIGLPKILCPGIFGKGGIKKSQYKDYLAFENIIDKGKFPPTYQVTSTEDMVHEAPLKFKQLLDEKGIENQIDDFGKIEERKLEHVFSVLYPSEYPESVETIDHMTQFFLAHV